MGSMYKLSINRPMSVSTFINFLRTFLNNRDFIEMRDKLKQEVSEVISKLNK